MGDSVLQQLREEEREARRDLILDSVIDLFAQKPFDEIGMRDIAAEAGVSPAAIYRYFPSQEDLFMEAFLKDLKYIGGHFKWRLKGKHKSAAPLEDFATSLVDYLIDNEATFQMVSYMMVKGNMPETILLRFNALQSSFMDKIVEVLEMAGFKEDSRMIAHTFFASIMGILMTFRNYPGRDKPEIKDHIHKLVRLSAGVFKSYQQVNAEGMAVVSI